ncbi:MAG: hypothetical protein AAGN66_14185 [Acidobacteriota bacterium]
MSTAPSPPYPSGPRPSAIAPISQAYDRMVEVLFRPFDLGKWLGLGLCAWLALLGQGGGSTPSVGSNFENRVSTSTSVESTTTTAEDLQRSLDEAKDWLAEHAPALWVAGGLAFALIATLLLIVTWLSSRGQMMFIDGVVRNRGEVVEPWSRLGPLANSLFGFRVIVGLVALVVMTAPLALALMHVWEEGFTGLGPETLLVPTVLLTFLFWLAAGMVFGLVALTVNDFVAPLMWLRRQSVVDAWRELRALLSANLGTFLVFLLVRILLSVTLGVVIVLATCLTCCVAALPYIGTVLLLPLHVFLRAYSLSFLGQFGRDYAPLAPARETPVPAVPTQPPPTGTSRP